MSGIVLTPEGACWGRLLHDPGRRQRASGRFGILSDQAKQRLITAGFGSDHDRRQDAVPTALCGQHAYEDCEFSD
jgi:hypothetical protein